MRRVSHRRLSGFMIPIRVKIMGAALTSLLIMSVSVLTLFLVRQESTARDYAYARAASVARMVALGVGIGLYSDFSAVIRGLRLGAT